MSCLVLDLDNFECDFLSQSSPEILNSPRSLEACATLFIQPIELVYRSLKEYEEELSDLPLSRIYQIFEIEETERQSKLLKCREFRNRMISKAARKEGERTKGRAMSAMGSKTEVRKRVPDFGGSDSEVNYGSDTESHEEYWKNAEAEDAQQRPKSRTRQRKTPFKEIQPLKSTSNIDFKKLLSSPRHLCSCHFNLNNDDIVNDYMHRYGDLIASRNDLSRDDKRILELLVLRKGRDAEWTKKSQELRQVIEEDKMTGLRRNQLKTQTWAERLAEKRRLANVESTNRYLQLEQEAKNRRQNLLNYLEIRDSKVQEYLDQVQYQKQKQMIQRHTQDALRQLEVGKAIERILEADRQQRLQLAEKLERRMCDSELRRKRKEMDNLRHIAEMNRLEDIKRELKQERLEQEARNCTEALRNQLEEKEHRATMNYLSNVCMRNALLSQGAGSRNMALERTRKAHNELLQRLEDWNKKVFELYLASQERATLNHCAEINRRRARVMTDRILRESRSIEIQKRVKEMQEQRMELMKAVIESKDFRSARIKEQKEKRMYISRLRAQHGAELREALKEKMDPETFDKKAARADIECQLLRKHPPKAVRFTNQIPKLNIGRQLCCRCGCTSAANGVRIPPQLRNRNCPPAHICRQK